MMASGLEDGFKKFEAKKVSDSTEEVQTILLWLINKWLTVGSNQKERANTDIIVNHLVHLAGSEQAAAVEPFGFQQQSNGGS